MKKKRLLLALLAMLLTISPTLAEVIKGSCGDNATYTLDTESGLLKIEGTGVMKDFRSSGSVPWYLNRSNIVSVEIKEGITRIGNYAFAKCSNLRNVSISNSLTSIGESAFDGCVSLSIIMIPSFVNNIGSYAFYGCNGLSEITCKATTPPSLGWDVFDDVVYDCAKLYVSSGYVSVYASATQWNLFINIKEMPYVSGSCTEHGITYHFNKETGHLTIRGTGNMTHYSEKYYPWHDFRDKIKAIDIMDGITSIGYYAFIGCSGLTSIIIPNSVTSIEDNAFSSCSSLTSITIPNSVTSIGDGAFASCSSLTSITIPESITSIGYMTFASCSSLTSITIPNSVTNIGDYAFEDCKSLTSFTIPESVISIGDFAFYGCHLRSLICKSNSPCVVVGRGNFTTSIYNHTQVYVPEGAYWDYVFGGWGDFIYIKEFATSMEKVNSSKAYMIADAQGYNYKVYDQKINGVKTVAYSFGVEEDDADACWQVLRQGSKCYLYNVGARQYAKMDKAGNIALTDQPMAMDIETNNEGIKLNGIPCMLVLNSMVDTEDGIEVLKAILPVITDDVPVYDLSGRRVQKAEKGLYIQNGKKVVMK